MKDAFVGRQPVFDRDGNVVAYELLFRASQSANSAIHEADGSQLTANVLVGSLMDIGLDQISSNKMVYINAPRDFLVSDIASILPPEFVAIEVLEDVQVDDEVVKACHALKKNGFTLLLDDFIYSPQWEPLMKIADIIKIDVMASEDLAAEVGPLRKYPAKLLAEKVETQEDLEHAKSLGFDYFQGYFFCRPAVVSGKKVPESKLAILRALREVMVAEAIQDLEKVIVHDVGLSYRLLKYINSAAFCMRSEIKTVRQALSLLGLKKMQIWLSVLCMATVAKDKPQELIHVAMLRGRILEQTGATLNLPGKTGCFTLGLFSLLDAFLDLPMKDALVQVRLPQDVYEGLTDPCSHYGRLLQMVKSIEMGNWDDVESMCRENGLNCEDLMAIHLSSIKWVDEYAEWLNKV
jgi:EAL and modified HD-GYP domain-containing signal transduction protein